MHHYVYLDYYTALANDQGAFKSAYTKDGVHPNDAGYKIMMPLAKNAIKQALSQPSK